MSLSKKIIIPLAFPVFLLIVRIVLSGELTYIFLAWNLFLAWIPFAISQKITGVQNRWKIVLLMVLWLLFLPNAPYIITDFLHLQQRPPIPYWYDILLLFSSALIGLLLGLLSLSNVEKFLAGRYGNRITGLLIFCSFFLCAFGIYMGRYLRWNSWDIVTNPAGIVTDILERVFNPFEHFGTWSVTFLFGSFFYVIYYSIKNLVNIKSNQF
ncbi:MAG TPA: DUF1361 domain-containing protein [Chitinophagaceae bacterium]|nr:DUF1361 domain-containing protein [Chitinophagaceae bacterium]